jgi:salicylate hydroxylase
MAQVLKIESFQSEKAGSVSFGLASPSPSLSPSSSASLPPTPEPTPQPISEQDPLPGKTTTTTALSTPPLSSTTSIAIIGGGIIGLITALGLIHRGLNVIVYERASKLTETSAGFSFNAVAREAMEFISPNVREALRSVAAPNEYPFIRYFDGYTPQKEGGGEEEPLWQIPADRPDYHGCLRAAFLEALGREVPEGVLRFGMGLEGYEEVDTDNGEKVRLRFAGGEVVDVDAGMSFLSLNQPVKDRLHATGGRNANGQYSHRLRRNQVADSSDHDRGG